MEAAPLQCLLARSASTRLNAGSQSTSGSLPPASAVFHSPSFPSSSCLAVLAKQVLLALARSVGEDSGDEAAGATVGEVAAGEGGDAEGEGGADELLFFVSTDADQTMFGR